MAPTISSIIESIFSIPRAAHSAGKVEVSCTYIRTRRAPMTHDSIAQYMATIIRNSFLIILSKLSIAVGSSCAAIVIAPTGAAAESNTQIIQEVTKACDGAFEIVANGKRASINVKGGLDIIVEGDGSVSVRKNGELTKLMEHFTADDRQRCIDNFLKFLLSKAEGRDIVPVIKKILTTFADESNTTVLSTLRENDGKKIYLDTINADFEPGLPENSNITNNCTYPDLNSDSKVDSITVPLPMPQAYYKKNNLDYSGTKNDFANYICDISIEVNFDKPTKLLVSSGGTGIINFVIRRNFVVNFLYGPGSFTRIGLREVN